MSLPALAEIMRHKTVVKWWLILHSPTKLWGVMCL